MDTKNLEALIELAKESGLAELQYETKEEKIKIKFPFGDTQAVVPMNHQNAGLNLVGQETKQVSEKSNLQDGLIEVTSPFVGTFYRSPSPDAEAYVKVGQKVSKGQVLCIIEAMKIMNEIETEISGEIVEVCVENENYVEFGQVLFLIKAK